MFKIQRYSNDYTFKDNSLSKKASVAEDVARKQPSASNDSNDGATITEEVATEEAATKPPVAGSWVQVTSPSYDGMSPGKSAQGMKFKYQQIKVDHTEDMMAWVSSGLGVSIAFPKGTDDMYLWTKDDRTGTKAKPDGGVLAETWRDQYKRDEEGNKIPISGSDNRFEANPDYYSGNKKSK